MFRPILVSAILTLSVAACGGGNPFREPPPTTPGPGPGTGPGGEAVSGVTGLPGTAQPAANRSIWRREATGVGQSGNGYIRDVRYDAVADTFSVDGLAFDGNNIYARDRSVNLGTSSRVYRSADLQIDPINGDVIPQLTHRAIYGTNNPGTMSFAIVRTGAYQDFGFGGFIYEREGGYSLPAPDNTGNRGDGSYRGEYAGIRDFSTAQTLEYVSGDASMIIDYDDFNDGHGVIFSVDNRRVYDIDGNDITSAVAASLPGVVTTLPVITTGTLPPGVADGNGEITGTVYDSSTGISIGTYYAVLGGTNATEVVGIVALAPTADPRNGYGEVRETGGFVLTRN